MESKLKLSLCLASLALFYLVTPGAGETFYDIHSLDPCDVLRRNILTVRYDSMGDNIVCGQKPVDRYQWLCREPPSIEYMNADEGERYLLVMVDPDAPSPENPFRRYWLHWMVTDIEGDDLKRGIESQEWDSIGMTLMSYTPPAPPKGVHRYQFFLFELQSGQDVTLNSDARGKFDIEAFSPEYLLVASTQFRASASNVDTAAII